MSASGKKPNLLDVMEAALEERDFQTARDEDVLSVEIPNAGAWKEFVSSLSEITKQNAVDDEGEIDFTFKGVDFSARLDTPSFTVYIEQNED